MIQSWTPKCENEGTSERWIDSLRPKFYPDEGEESEVPH